MPGAWRFLCLWRQKRRQVRNIRLIFKGLNRLDNRLGLRRRQDGGNHVSEFLGDVFPGKGIFRVAAGIVDVRFQ